MGHRTTGIETTMKVLAGVIFSLATVTAASAQNAQNFQASVPAAEVHRVVTALDANGKAIALFNGPVPLTSVRSPNPAGEMWITTKSPTDYSAQDDWAKTNKVGVAPPKGGTIFRIVEFPPTSEKVNAMPVDTMMKVVGDSAPKRGLPPRHSMMHRTRTLDYALIMSGEIDMLLDDSEVHLKAGDVLVQQATNHAWINRGKEPCRIAFVLMDAQEP
jgi:mannose-6-phosphate isomerase-like protein (cupin superfamily)